MKLFITGADGQLGRSLLNSEFLPEDWEVFGFERNNLDITDRGKVLAEIENLKPDVIINCAAYTDVDGAETHRESAFVVNVKGTENLAQGAEKTDAKLIHISTDFVFDGCAGKPYKETDKPNPINVYGETKLQGEKFVLEYEKGICLRTAWLYGKDSKNFVNAIRNLTAFKPQLSVVDDQIGSPTFADDLTEIILKLCTAEVYGLYHCVNDGFCSRYELAKEIVKLSANNCNITPCKSDAFPSPAKRPEFSALDCSLIEQNLNIKIRNWQEALQSYFIKETP